MMGYGRCIRLLIARRKRHATALQGHPGLTDAHMVDPGRLTAHERRV